MNARDIARRLIQQAAQTEAVTVAFDQFNDAEGVSYDHLGGFAAEQLQVGSAEQLVAELDAALVGAGWVADAPTLENFDEGSWTFGVAIQLIGRRHGIHGGYLEEVRSIPLLNRLPDRVVLYLLTVEDGVDYLKREAHSGVGWHYHYLDWKERRSNVILCWDTRWNPPEPQPEPPKRRGLFVERHAEGGKPFSARPDAWGPKKRQSMYNVCATDLRSRKIEEYRCAANKSEPVYPPEAKLTPHPSSATKAAGKGTKKGS